MGTIEVIGVVKRAIEKDNNSNGLYLLCEGQERPIVRYDCSNELKAVSIVLSEDIHTVGEIAY